MSKKCLTKLQRMKYTQSKIKLIKTGKKNLEQHIVWGEKTLLFRPQEVKMINEVLREKSNCVVCRSDKSRFLKQKHNNKK